MRSSPNVLEARHRIYYEEDLFSWVGASTTRTMWSAGRKSPGRVLRSVAASIL